MSDSKTGVSPATTTSHERAVQDLAMAIFDNLCPGIRLDDKDVEVYQTAARAAISTLHFDPTSVDKDCDPTLHLRPGYARGLITAANHLRKERDRFRKSLEKLKDALPKVPRPEPGVFQNGETGWCVAGGNNYVTECRVEYWRNDPAIYVLKYLGDWTQWGSSSEDFHGTAYKTEAEARAARYWNEFDSYRWRLEELAERDAKDAKKKAAST